MKSLNLVNGDLRLTAIGRLISSVLQINQSIWVLLMCDQKLTNSQFNPTHATNNKIMEKIKRKTVEQYRIREGNPVDVRWANRHKV